jgi:ribulose-phosphate 3-epimerase
MQSSICPTVLAEHPHDYREQMEKVVLFAARIQIDLMDGVFAPSRSITPEQVWFPDSLQADIHVMFQRPLEYLETLISLKPHMIIFHAESDGDIKAALEHIQKLGIKAGIALLKTTTPEIAHKLIEVADHVLLFSGELGQFGGTADLHVLDKIAAIKSFNPSIEIGWDGGANETNVAQLASAGVNVINVGSAIQKAENPHAAYQHLVSLIS